MKRNFTIATILATIAGIAWFKRPNKDDYWPRLSEEDMEIAQR